jgi:hypothetical protein
MSVLFSDAGMTTKRSVGTLGEADLRGKKVLVHANLNVPLDDARKIRGKKRKILVALRHLHLLRPIPPAQGRRVSNCISPRSLTPAIPSKLVIKVFHAFNLAIFAAPVSSLPLF